MVRPGAFNLCARRCRARSRVDSYGHFEQIFEPQLSLSIQIMLWKDLQWRAYVPCGTGLAITTSVLHVWGFIEIMSYFVLVDTVFAMFR